MIDLPDEYPKYCMDIKQYAVMLNVNSMPTQIGNEHDALADARHNLKMYKHIKQSNSRPAGGLFFF